MLQHVYRKRLETYRKYLIFAVNYISLPLCILSFFLVFPTFFTPNSEVKIVAILTFVLSMTAHFLNHANLEQCDAALQKMDEAARQDKVKSLNP